MLPGMLLWASRKTAASNRSPAGVVIEGQGILFVVEGIEKDAEPIRGGGDGVAFFCRRLDPVRFAVEKAAGDINVVVVVSEKGLRSAPSRALRNSVIA